MKPVSSKVSVSSLINAIQATLRGRSAEERLQLLGQAKAAGELLNDELAFDAAMRMRCYAELGNLDASEECVYQAREAYARHMNLTDSEVAAYVKNDFALYGSNAYKARNSEGIRNCPWFYELFDNGFAILPPLENTYIGDTLEERQRNAKSGWASFADNEEALRGYLAILYLRLEKWAEAAAILDSISGSADIRGSQIRGEMQLRSLWPLVIAGQCYARLGNHQDAVGRWQTCRSFELLCAENDEFCRDFGIFWIEKAKKALADLNVGIPALEASVAAGQHLASAWNWMLQAESWMDGMGLDQELMSKFNYSGTEFRMYVDNASAALTNVYHLDPFTRTKVKSTDGVDVWAVPDFIVAEIWHMRGVCDLLMDQFGPAINAFTQSIRTASSLASHLWLGLTHEISGNEHEARNVYNHILNHGKSLANSMSEDEASCEQFIESARSLLARPLGG